MANPWLVRSTLLSFINCNFSLLDQTKLTPADSTLRGRFTACRGKGAWLNETTQLPLDRHPIPPLPESAPKGCVFSCEWGKDRRDIPDGNLHRKVNSFMNMAAELGSREGKGGMVHGVRSLGSATLDLAYVAMGSFDIWWEGGCWLVYAV